LEKTASFSWELKYTLNHVKSPILGAESTISQILTQNAYFPSKGLKVYQNGVQEAQIGCIVAHLRITYLVVKSPILADLIWEDQNIGRFTFNLGGSCHGWIWRYRVVS